METFDGVKSWAAKYLYYIIIFILSVCACVFLPMIGSDSPFGWSWPNTTLGWVLYIASAVLVAGVNMSLFFSFQQQAKINVKDNPQKIFADKLLRELNLKHPLKIKKPRSPQKYNTNTYGFKGTMTAITSFGSAFVFVQAVVKFDWIDFLTYFLTIVFGLIFGFMSMKLSEQYWTDEYYEYALLKEKELENTEVIDNGNNN